MEKNRLIYGRISSLSAKLCRRTIGNNAPEDEGESPERYTRQDLRVLDIKREERRSKPVFSQIFCQNRWSFEERENDFVPQCRTIRRINRVLHLPENSSFRNNLTKLTNLRILFHLNIE